MSTTQSTSWPRYLGAYAAAQAEADNVSGYKALVEAIGAMRFRLDSLARIFESSSQQVQEALHSVSGETLSSSLLTDADLLTAVKRDIDATNAEDVLLKLADAITVTFLDIGESTSLLPANAVWYTADQYDQLLAAAAYRKLAELTPLRDQAELAVAQVRHALEQWNARY